MMILKMRPIIVLEWSNGHLSKDPSSSVVILHKDSLATLVDCHLQYHNFLVVGFK
uniref:Uncharacterized protein n=1 Tax=Marmota marmota marmota TaxID=9994 RepID=A0A8C5YZK0_MARMA